MGRSRGLLFRRRFGVVALARARWLAAPGSRKLYNRRAGNRWRRRGSGLGRESQSVFRRDRFSQGGRLRDGLIRSCAFRRIQPRLPPQSQRLLLLPLARRTPCRRASANGGVPQRCPMLGADALPFPLLVDQPALWWIREIPTGRSERVLNHELRCIEYLATLSRG